MTKLTALIQFQRFAGGFQACGRPPCAQEILKNNAGLVRQSHDGVVHHSMMLLNLVAKPGRVVRITKPAIDARTMNADSLCNIRYFGTPSHHGQGFPGMAGESPFFGPGASGIMILNTILKLRINCARTVSTLRRRLSGVWTAAVRSGDSQKQCWLGPPVPRWRCASQHDAFEPRGE